MAAALDVLYVTRPVPVESTVRSLEGSTRALAAEMGSKSI